MILQSKITQILQPQSLNLTNTFQKIQDYFNQEQAKLNDIYQIQGEGAVRHATGELYEKLIDLIIKFKLPNLDVKVGSSDFFQHNTIIPNMAHLQPKTTFK